jgi:NDP-sugar pyrophosphorylase family protein
MKAMIFAAGKGTRLNPFSYALPKSLLPLRGRTVIDWILLRLQEAGVREVMINLHHQGEKIQKYLGNGSGRGLSISYSPEKELLGTGGGLKQVEEFFEEGTFLVLNSDMYFEFALAELVARHRERKAEVTLVLKAGMDTFLYGGICLDAAGRVLPPDRRPAGGGRLYLFTGISILEPAVFSYLNPQPSSVIPAFLRMAAEGRPVFGEIAAGRWEDLGTVANYLSASNIP